MKRCLLTPLIENMTDTDIISSRGVLRVGAPARAATSASPVASTTRAARIASRPALLSTMTPRMAPSSHDGRDELAVQHRLHAGLLHEHVGDELEHLGVERVADRLRLGHCGAHGPGALLELDADALAVDRRLVPVPREALDADLRDVAAEAAVPLEQRRAHAGARAGERRREPTGPAADDEHVGLVDYVDLACGFRDSVHAGAMHQRRGVPGDFADQSIGRTSGTTTSHATSPHNATTPETMSAEV